MKILFIGNSATYVNDVPKMLERLARGAGYEIETDMVVKGGFRLSQHAAGTMARDKIALEELEKGYDLVILQEVGNCFTTEEHRLETAEASEILVRAARETNAKVMFYVRPPYGRGLEGYTAEEQCPLLDDLFVGLSKKLDVECIFVNRAFACAIPTVGRALWGDDNAHTSPKGAYLIACTFFATIFGKSATVLDSDVLTPEEARPLQEFADQVALECLIPWKN